MKVFNAMSVAAPQINGVLKKNWLINVEIVNRLLVKTATSNYWPTRITLLEAPIIEPPVVQASHSKSRLLHFSPSLVYIYISNFHSSVIVSTAFEDCIIIARVSHPGYFIL
jgi:hypothetical protein